METIVKGYKVTNADMQCKNFQFELNKKFVHKGDISPCHRGFHFCEVANDCFDYYSFDPANRVFEVEATGLIKTEGNKSCTSEITFVREIPWLELLTIVNMGKENTGRANSGYWNSGNWNSGNWNSGDSNSGDSNSGYRNSGYSNSGYRNSGYRNSGNWNSGDRNSGDSNSGYRNSGAFCLDQNPMLVLFDKPTNITVKEWEQMEVCQLMYSIDPTIWVPMSIMSHAEKLSHPKYETTEGYLKTISMKEAWANFWGNMADDKKSLFTSLPNFDADKFEQITGIKV